MPAGGNRRRRVVLRRENIAGRPAHRGAKLHQRFDQHRRLDRHMQAADDARALERLRRAIFLAHRHKAGHFGLGDIDFLAAPFGKAQILDLEIVGNWRGVWRRRTWGIENLG